MGAYDVNLGEQIQNAVQNAINTQNFSQLNRSISEAVNTSLQQINTNQNRFYQDYAEQETTVEELEHVDGEIVNGDAKADFEARRRAAREEAERARRESRQAQEARQRAEAYEREKARERNWERRRAQYQQYWQEQQANRQRQQYYNSQAVRNANHQRRNSTEIVPIAKNPAGKVSGTVLTVFGTLGLIASVAMSFGFEVAASFGMPTVIYDGLMGGLVSPCLIAGAIMLIAGRKKKKRVNRFYQYVRQLRGRAYCTIKELSSHIGKSDRFVLKDLRKMISLGMFPEGHIDEQQTCLMLNGATYEQYRKAQTSYQNRMLEEEERRRHPERFVEQQKQAEAVQQAAGNSQNAASGTETSKKQLPPEVVKILSSGKQYMAQIREANDAIPGEVISAKLDQLEQVIGKIYARIEEHPEQVDELEKFIRYYLPTTLKLVNAYREFDAQSVQGENIQNSKKEIEATLDTILYAFETLLDSLYEDDALDISTDISVLQTMFAQEGLTKGVFEKEK
ncbi:MAG: 5-bromo-4-chloroindolyl phosphate hydrolysis family protein [Lachnospiraceae bacterium]|nr:5-bromo-4-chloroindolyl phosphate hydrolysis family protein [Lachnospiraceae bacterium]